MFFLLSPLLLAQSAGTSTSGTQRFAGPVDQQKAHDLLAATIQALGGQAWLNIRTMHAEGRMVAFFHGAPTGSISDVTIAGELPDKQRIDIGRHGRVVQILRGKEAWEITYQGKRGLSATQTADLLRFQAHSLDTVFRDWYPNSTTMLIDGGPSQVERHRVENITLIRATNDAETLEIDLETHLPLRWSYEWRDPRFHDKTVDTVEYDNYQKIDGIEAPFTITRVRNGETISELYLKEIKYNIALPEDLFDPDYAAAHLK